MIDVQGQIAYWLKGAEEDLSTASILLSHGKFLEALFFTHLAIEKGLKAYVVKATGIVAPRTHNLLRLSELGQVSLDDPTIELFGKLMIYQLEGRYPSETSLKPSKEFSQDIFDRSQKVLKWLRDSL
jgi:HEPN domain-containing protein